MFRIKMFCRRSLSINKTLYARNVHIYQPLFCKKEERPWPFHQQYAIDPEAERLGEVGVQELKKHHGAVARRCGPEKSQIPDSLNKAMNIIMERRQLGHFRDEVEPFARMLEGRHFPQEGDQLAKRASMLEKQFLQNSKIDLDQFNDEELEEFKEKLQKEVVRQVRKSVYRWKPIHYNARESVLYMLARMTGDYAAIYRVFSEIKTRDEEFNPRTMLDFGSGVGSAVWAANSVWPKRMYEHICVDASLDMNTLARLLMQEGDERKNRCFKGVHFRSFLPASHENTYDLVISAHSLFEHHTQNERLRNILSLWRKTEKYLVIVELGTFAGFRLVQEARDFILRLSQLSDVPRRLPRKMQEFIGPVDDSLKGHVFAPYYRESKCPGALCTTADQIISLFGNDLLPQCSHDLDCPMLKSLNKEPCNFKTAFMHKRIGVNSPDIRHSLFSYVILKKGIRNENDVEWPRIVRTVIRPPKQVVCKLCSTDGKLHSTILTKSKFGKDLFVCAKACKWGDRLPVIPDPDGPPFQKKITRSSKFKKRTKRPAVDEESEKLLGINISDVDTVEYGLSEDTEEDYAEEIEEERDWGDDDDTRIEDEEGSAFNTEEISDVELNLETMGLSDSEGSVTVAVATGTKNTKTAERVPISESGGKQE